MSFSVQSSSVTPSSLQAFPPPDALRAQSQGGSLEDVFLQLTAAP